MAKPKSTKEEVNPMELLEKEMASAGLAGTLRTIDLMENMDVVCIPSGFKSLDDAIRPTNGGFPLGRDVEIYSREPEVGKTTLGLDVLRAFQELGLRTALIQPENTITLAFLQEQRIKVYKAECEGHKMLPVHIMPAYNETTGDPLTAEEILETIRKASKVFDYILVDSLPALIQASDLEKEADEASRTGGIGKLLTDHCRKTTIKRACVVWINQQIQQVGARIPGMPPIYRSRGGMAIPFFGSLRIDLSMVSKIEEGNGDDKKVIGIRTKAFISKNKIAPPYRVATLNYLNGEGFSPVYDYFELAIKMNIIEKSGSWFNFGVERLAQGKNNAYRVIRDNPELLGKIQALVDGESVTE
jgi:recombination protein RecA